MPVKAKEPGNNEKNNAPVLVPRPNGQGALNSGGTPGNKGGWGRPRSEIRELSRNGFAETMEAINARIIEDKEKKQLSLSELARAGEVQGKYGLGEAATETLADDQLVSLCLDWCHDFMSRAGMVVEPSEMAKDFEAFRKDRL